MTTHAIRFSGTAPIVAITMTARLDPPAALAYLRSLSTDVRAAAVLGPEGDVLAGDPALAGRAGEAGLLSVGEGARSSSSPAATPPRASCWGTCGRPWRRWTKAESGIRAMLSEAVA